ncbi:WbqC family protein [Herbaspirillum huttiense]|uniref:WbqC family protein n=1 Tax=Herbaspirillum huttiense TaxID=863372 RepID=UPI0039B04822
MSHRHKLAIMQPYFLPYIGYFQLMEKVDAFVVFDDVSFINKGWINRNRICINGAAHLFTIPLLNASQNRRICDIAISPDMSWRKKLLKTFHQAYLKAPQFERVFPLVEEILLFPSDQLSAFLLNSIEQIHKRLELRTELIPSSRCYGNAEIKGQERIIDICRQEDAHVYINPPGGKELYDENAFAAAELELKFLTPVLDPYPQGGSPFLAGLSIIDVLMNNDPSAISRHLSHGAVS